MQNTEKLKVNTSTIIRTICLALALVNQILSSMGKPVIPIEDEQVETFITVSITIGTAIWSWWKNNSITQAALQADEALKCLKGDK